MIADSRFRRSLLSAALAAACVLGGTRVAAGQTIEAAALSLAADTFAPETSLQSQQQSPPPASEPQEKSVKGKGKKPVDQGVEEVIVLTRSPENTGFKALMRNTWGDFKALPSEDSLVTLAVGGSVSLALSGLDDTINDDIRENGWNESFWLPGKYLGLGEVQIGLAIGTWAVGEWKDPQGWLAHLGLDLLRAQIVTQTLTYGLKVATQRERPDGSDGLSFPSGHASTTFATATVLQRHLGLKAALPTYAVATYVAMSRLYENRHHLSDVAFGATVGLIAGRTVTRHGRHNYAMIPLAVPGGVGIGFTRVGW